MKIVDIPFNKLIGLQESTSPALLELPADKKYTNHLGTVHAAALFALAEAAAGEFLMREFLDLIDNIVPVVRGAEVKFKRPAAGTISAYAKFISDAPAVIRATLQEKKRVSVHVQVELTDVSNTIVFTCKFDWFVTMK